MALAKGTVRLDGRRRKIVTVTCLDNDAAANISLTFVGDYGCAVAMQGAPLTCSVVKTTSTDIALDFAVTAMSADGFTLRKLTAGGAGGAVTVNLDFLLPRGIAS